MRGTRWGRGKARGRQPGPNTCPEKRGAKSSGLKGFPLLDPNQTRTRGEERRPGMGGRGKKKGGPPFLNCCLTGPKRKPTNKIRGEADRERENKCGRNSRGDTICRKTAGVGPGGGLNYYQTEPEKDHLGGNTEGRHRHPSMPRGGVERGKKKKIKREGTDLRPKK